MKKNRHFKTLMCLALGVVVLAGAAFANYDNASGYTQLKNGIKRMMYEENFTLSADVSLSLDGKTLESAQECYMYDHDGEVSYYNKSGTWETWYQNGFQINSSPDGYYVYPTESKGLNDSYINASDDEKEMADKVINFVELLSDTFVGDLKNNFVVVGSGDGQKTYQISLAGDQIPALINSGLSLAFSSARYAATSYSSDSDVYSTPNPYRIEVEDYAALEEQGEFDVRSKACDILNENGGGVAYIRSDGTIDYYATEEEFYAVVGEEEYVSGDATLYSFEGVLSRFASDPFIENVKCTVTFDDEGRILEGKAEGTLSGYDENGDKHSYTLSMNVTISDYGTTSITPFDTTLLKEFDWDLGYDGYANFDKDGNRFDYKVDYQNYGYTYPGYDPTYEFDYSGKYDYSRSDGFVYSEKYGTYVPAGYDEEAI